MKSKLEVNFKVTCDKIISAKATMAITAHIVEQ